MELVSNGRYLHAHTQSHIHTRFGNRIPILFLEHTMKKRCFFLPNSFSFVLINLMVLTKQKIMLSREKEIKTNASKHFFHVCSQKPRVCVVHVRVC